MSRAVTCLIINEKGESLKGSVFIEPLSCATCGIAVGLAKYVKDKNIGPSDLPILLEVTECSEGVTSAPRKFIVDSYFIDPVTWQMALNYREDA